jgi:hypothetical protein
VQHAQLFWDLFEKTHMKAALPGALEIPMESFTRTVEIVLRESYLRDTPTYAPPEELCSSAVRSSGYVQSRRATSSALRESIP